MYIASIASSSTKGNAYLVWGESARPVLIDCGVSIRKIVSALRSLGMHPNDLSGIFITHEHSDHIKALCLVTPIAQKFGIPVYSSCGFWKWYKNRVGSYIDPQLVRCISCGRRVVLDGAEVQAFSKPHDCNEPLGYIVEICGQRVSFVMDLGHVPEKVELAVSGSDYFVFESNHDVDMEKTSGRPNYLIRRVLGNLGHLSNYQAACSLSKVVKSNTKMVILAHLSMDCNIPSLAVSEIESTLFPRNPGLKIEAAPAGELRLYVE